MIVAAGAVTFGMPRVDVAGEHRTDGRTWIRYEHESHPNWGYARPQRNYFIVVPARAGVTRPPLRVILHSLRISAGQALEIGFRDRDDAPQFYGGADFCLLYLDVRNGGKDGVDSWWGAGAATKSRGAPVPTEKRVLSTIEWVVDKYGVDRDRIYLSGLSMGGSGSLGIGMGRGDIFAAVSVQVPARTEHLLARLNADAHPEPPPLINVFSQSDPWSVGMENLQKLMHDGRYAYACAWGPFEHTASIGTTNANAAVIEFPWLEIRKNEAYPVFTDATTDDRYPGHMNLTGPDQRGQVNGYFRWRTLEDTRTRPSCNPAKSPRTGTDC